MIKIKYGYIRNSPGGRSIKSQTELMKKEGLKSVQIYREKYNGENAERPHYNALLKKLKPSDELVVSEIDRLANDDNQILKLISNLRNRKVNIKILNPDVKLDSEEKSKLVCNGIKISMRINHLKSVEKSRKGIIYSKRYNRSYYKGRPNRFRSKKRGMYLAIVKYADNHSATDTAKTFNISKRTVFSIKKDFKNYNQQ